MCPVTTYPLQFKQELAKQRLQPVVLGSEAELLRLLFEFVAAADPDLVVGHNIVGNALVALQARIIRLKLPWAKLGRLRRSARCRACWRRTCRRCCCAGGWWWTRTRRRRS